MDPAEYNRLLLLRERQIRDEELRMAAIRNSGAAAVVATPAIAALPTLNTAAPSAEYQKTLNAMLLQEAQAAALAKQQQKQQEEDDDALLEAAQKEKREKKRQAQIAAEEAERVAAQLEKGVSMDSHDPSLSEKSSCSSAAAADRISADLNKRLLQGEREAKAEETARPEAAPTSTSPSKPAAAARNSATPSTSQTFEPFVDSHGRQITPLTADELQSIQRGVLQVPPTMTLAQTPEGIPILVSTAAQAPPTDLNTTDTEKLPYYDTLLLEQRLTRNKVENVENLLTQQRKKEQKKRKEQQHPEDQTLDTSHSSSSNDEEGGTFPNLKDQRYRSNQKEYYEQQQRERKMQHQQQQRSPDSAPRPSPSSRREYRERSNSDEHPREHRHRHSSSPQKRSSPQHQQHHSSQQGYPPQGYEEYYRQQQQRQQDPYYDQRYYQQHGHYPQQQQHNQQYSQYHDPRYNQQYQQYYQQHGRYPEEHYHHQQQQQYYYQQQQQQYYQQHGHGHGHSGEYNDSSKNHHKHSQQGYGGNSGDGYGQQQEQHRHKSSSSCDYKEKQQSSKKYSSDYEKQKERELQEARQRHSSSLRRRRDRQQRREGYLAETIDLTDEQQQQQRSYRSSSHMDHHDHREERNRESYESHNASEDAAREAKRRRKEERRAARAAEQQAKKQQEAQAMERERAALLQKEAAAVAEANSAALQMELQRKILQAASIVQAHTAAANVTALPTVISKATKPPSGKLKQQLPPTFLPSSNTVIVIDDKDPANTPIPGNKLLRDLGFQWLDDYMTVPQPVHDLRKESMDKFVNAVRRHKFKVVKKLVKMVNQLNSVAGFVTFDRATNTWWEVTEEAAWREAKNVITFCRDLKQENQKPGEDGDVAATDKIASPEGAKKRKSSKATDLSSPSSKKKRKTVSAESSPEGKRGAYRCGKCGELKKKNGRKHVCKGKRSKKQIVEESDSEEEEEENLAPEGFHAYQGGIQVYKKDNHYMAKPIGDNAPIDSPAATKADFKPPENKDAMAESVSDDDDEEMEGIMDDGDDALIF